VNAQQALTHYRTLLTDNNIEDAALEGEILLRHILGIDRTKLFSNPDIVLTQEQVRKLETLVQRRISGEPTAYITGHREFYGLDFHVNESVLIPRPETELLVEKALEIARKRDITRIADAGTGCGAIAVTLAVSLPDVKIYATDISEAALEVAALNCKRHGVDDRVTLFQGDMLGPVPERVDMITANLPYVRVGDIPVSGSISYEPVTALNGGPDGLDKLKEIFRQAGDKLNPGGYVLAETGHGQARIITHFIRVTLEKAEIQVFKDLAGIERLVIACLTTNAS